MSDHSAIAWTDATWNPVRGCTKVSAGCRNCYAETFAERWRGVPGHPYERGFDLRLVPEALELPLRWRKPRRVFVNSMSDLFHEDVPDEFIAAVFAVMAAAPEHTFQVLTKRAERMRSALSDSAFLEEMERAASRYLPNMTYVVDPVDGWPLPNVWLGVSVEDQAAADERIPHLLATPATVRFLSCEPLLGPVTLQPTIDAWASQVTASVMAGRPIRPLPPRIGWVIVGGESGPGARPCDVAWIRSLVEQCRAAGVPAFCKQLGANVIDRNDAGFDGDTPTSWPADSGVEHDESDTGYQGAPVRVHTRDRAGRDPAEWPADLRVREMPKGAQP